MIKFFGWAGVVIGTLRLSEYLFFGDIHRGHALAWMIHAFVSGVALLVISKKETDKSD